MIKEVIVVEGKDDVNNVKRAVSAEMITTSGMGLNTSIMEEIKEASRRCGIIILTDPDYPGDRIRQLVSDNVGDCKHAFLTQSQARCKKTGRIGVEYASPEDILKALEEAKACKKDYKEKYTMDDLFNWEVVGLPSAKIRRDALAEILGIGKVNGKQFLRRINAYDIPLNEINQALIQIEKAGQ